MPEAWECDGRVFVSKEAAEEYAAKLADPPPIHRAGHRPVATPRTGGIGCGTVALVLAAGAIVVVALGVLGRVEVSGVVVLLVAALIGWRADVRIRDLKARVRKLEREKDQLQRELWDLQAED